MAGNYVLLETIELTQSAASVVFDNIPQTGYTDLKIVYSAQGTGGDQALYFYFNGSNANLSMVELFGSGTAPSSQAVASGFWGGITGATSGVGGTGMFASGEVYIPNYTSNNSKSIVSEWAQEDDTTAAYMAIHSGRWNPGTQAAITSITIYPGANNLSAGSTFSLYGVANVNASPTFGPFASGGNIVANDGTYWYHAFLSSGTFTPLKALSCDALVVAGGGGACAQGGGAGAGGFRTTTGLSVTTTQTVTVGAGGTSTSSTSVAGTNGGNSTFSTITSAGGGAGGNNTVAGTGGSGGGGGQSGASLTGGAGNTPSTSPSQGNNGGNNITNGGYPGGGGGGAGAVGGNGVFGVGGAGGIGSFNAISGGSTTGVGVLSSGNYYFAGGGGGGITLSGYTGGAGGTGGGGAGGQYNNNGTAGTANTGGGGGAAGSSGTGGTGGSGIVIVRYPMV